jgi:hypothetical protein
VVLVLVKSGKPPLAMCFFMMFWRCSGLIGWKDVYIGLSLSIATQRLIVLSMFIIIFPDNLCQVGFVHVCPLFRHVVHVQVSQWQSFITGVPSWSTTLWYLHRRRRIGSHGCKAAGWSGAKVGEVDQVDQVESDCDGSCHWSFRVLPSWITPSTSVHVRSLSSEAEFGV